MTSLLRAVFLTAERKFRSAHESIVLRSISGTSGISLRSAAVVGPFAPNLTPTVLKTMGIPKANAAFVRYRALSTTALGSLDPIAEITWS